MAKYNRQAAVRYALAWAEGTNPRYGRMANDCTNFVSQALLAGGWSMVGLPSPITRSWPQKWWFNHSPSGFAFQASYTWGGAENLRQFMTASRRGEEVAGSHELDVGDVVQYLSADKSHATHTMMVTDKQADDLMLSYHTTDHRNKPLSRIQESVPAELFVYWKVADTVPGWFN